MKLKALGILALSAFLTACCCDTPEPEQVCVQPGSVQDFCQNVGDRVYFDFDRYAIMPCGEETLRRQAEWLCRYGCNVTIVGHCDERGSTAYNMGLGERRAKAARDALVKCGVPSSRVTVCSMGKEKPIVAGSNEAAWAENRVSITVLCVGGSAQSAVASPGIDAMSSDTMQVQ